MLLARPDRRRAPPRREHGRDVGSASGASIYVETHGPEGAPPIIFTHGWGMDSTMWRYAKADLVDRFRLILWDLPGLGKSRAAEPHVDMRLLASELAALVTMTDGRPVLVGHSIGGMTIQTLVRDHPHLLHRIAGIVLLNTTYTNPLRTMVMSPVLRALQHPLLEPALRLLILLKPLVWLAQWQSYLSGHAHLAHRFGFGRRVTRSQLDQTALLATRNSPAVQMHGTLAMFHWDATGALAKAQVPVLIVGGALDIITKPEASQTIAQSAPSAELHIVADANHMGPLEAADAYNPLIEDFVGRVASQAAPTSAGSPG